MCNGNSDNVDLALGDDHAAVSRVPPCPEDSEQPHRDLWMERCEGILGSNGEPDENRMIHSFRNGRYQHIMFLGICGYVICNHCDKEILLVDPWPSHHSEWTGTIPTADPRPLMNGSTDAKQRLADLASFLRNAAGGNQEDRYTLSGILLSHMHFDHSEDIVVLLELMAAQTESVASFDDVGTYTDHLGRIYSLAGPPIEIDSLPKICCDYDTLIYLLTYYFYVPYDTISIDGNEVFRPQGRIRQWERAQGGRIRQRQRYWYGNEELEEVLYARARTCIEDRRDRIWNRHGPNGVMSTAIWAQVQRRYTLVPGTELVDNDSWLEISAVDTNGVQQRLHYDDSYNAYLEEESQRCRAGQRCDSFTLDNFLITPYVWDHMNTGPWKRRQMAVDGQAAGHLQRITAYMISHNSPNVIGAKRTFIIGSMGEMSERYTQALADTLPSITTDLLIIAVTKFHPAIGMWYDEERDDALSFLGRYITVRDAVIFTHFEEFIREIATPAKYVEDFRAIFLNEGMPGTGRMGEIQQHYYYRHRLDDGLEVIRPRLQNIPSHLPLLEDLRRRSRSYNRLFERNRFYVLVRHGFEIIDFPSDPIVFKNQRNEFHSFR